MKLEKYLDTINDTYNKSRETWNELQNTREANIQEIENTYTNNKMTEIQKAAKIERLKAENAIIVSRINDLREEAYKAMDITKHEMENDIRKSIEIDPTKVDSVAAGLIKQSSDSDLLALSRRYSDNATMLKLINNEAETRKSPEMMRLKANIDSYLSVDNKSEILDRAIITAYRGLNVNKDFAEVANNYWNNTEYNSVSTALTASEALNA